MRTYTHAVLSYLAAARLSGKRGAIWAAVGATLPDAPALAGSAWLLLRRRFSRERFHGEVCGRLRFRAPDAALHSGAVLAVPALTLAAWRLTGGRAPRAVPLVLGWAGHAAADLATHGADARPPLWPVSRRRFESPLSYRERDRHGRAFTLVEHAILAVLCYAAHRRRF